MKAGSEHGGTLVRRRQLATAAWFIGYLTTAGCGLFNGESGHLGQVQDAGIGSSSDDATVDGSPSDGGQPSDGNPLPDSGVAEPAVDIGIDLGHVDSIVGIDVVGARAVSVDKSGHWVLWDLDTSAPIMSADAPSYTPFRAASLHGGTVANLTTTTLEVRNATTGVLTGTIPLPTTNWNDPAQVPWDWGHAFDGSYVWIATSSSLRAWSSTGVSLVDVTGDYRDATLFASPEALRIQGGPAGANLIEVVDVATQGRSTFSYTGIFQSWFVDGERFLAYEPDPDVNGSSPPDPRGVKLGVYSKTGNVLASHTMSEPSSSPGGGIGDYVWTYEFPDLLCIYRINNLASPVAQYSIPQYPKYPRVFASLESLMISAFDGSTNDETIEIVTFGQKVVKTAPITVPIRTTALGHVNWSVYAGNASRWFVGNFQGAIIDSTKFGRALSYGNVTSIAGTENGIAAVATASGQTLILNIGATSSLTREVAATGDVGLTADGTTLLAATPHSFGSGASLRVMSVATGATLHSWDYPRVTQPVSSLLFLDYSFARAGAILCQLTQDSNGWYRVFSDFAGNVLPDYGPTGGNINEGSLPVFSPDGTKATMSPMLDTTNIYTNGTLTGVVDGRNLGWLGNDTLLVGKWGASGLELVTIYDAAGSVVSQSGLKQNDLLAIGLPMTDIGNGHIFITGVSRGTCPDYCQKVYANAVYDIATGAKVWQGDADVAGGAVVGDDILFSRGTRLLTQRFR